MLQFTPHKTPNKREAMPCEMCSLFLWGLSREIYDSNSEAYLIWDGI
jgi:hypothetical protein